MGGVRVVGDGGLVGAGAASPALAAKAAGVVRAEWKGEPQPSDREIFDYLKKSAAPGNERRDNSSHVVGDVEKAFAATKLHASATYNVQYIAHVPLETRAAVAQWDGDQLTVWTGTQ